MFSVSDTAVGAVDSIGEDGELTPTDAGDGAETGPDLSFFSSEGVVLEEEPPPGSDRDGGEVALPVG
ncbi:MAG TPA: hypothetical protein VKD72_34085, partial [Gemmataceae bacterium]|nr:hypothetical protein [Gemmataceae bacterium]